MNKPDRKRQERRKRLGTKSGDQTQNTDLPPMPPRHVVERSLRNIFAGGGNVRRARAQDLAFEAMEAIEQGEAARAVELAGRAVETDPACVDALRILAQASSRDKSVVIVNMRQVVRQGEETLGQTFFEKNEGYFWGIHETRPYMRARAALAQMLAKSGQREEAVRHYEGMLQLNPNDNQGLRYSLLGHYLELERLDDARRLFQQYEDDSSAMFAWARVLEQFLSGGAGGKGADQALDRARKINSRVESYLTKRKTLPAELPSYYGLGDENEAVICAYEIGEAWRCHPAAISWLRERS